MSVNSTLHIAHVAQPTFILRYVSPEGHSQELLLKFLPSESHAIEVLCVSLEQKDFFFAS